MYDWIVEVTIGLITEQYTVEDYATSSCTTRIKDSDIGRQPNTTSTS